MKMAAKVLWRYSLALLLISIPALSGAVEKRVALVIGNSDYQHVTPLDNPSNDAVAVADALEELGFRVQKETDLDARGFQQALRRFSTVIRDADVALFFYAGHGLQVDGRNYLASVDARLESETDLLFETLQVDDVLNVMETNAKTRLVFLDACRNNPLSRSLARNMGTRSTAVGRGLARVMAGAGTLVAYATAPGEVALDGQGSRNSPFTAGLLEHIKTPGLDIGRMLRRVRASVMAETNNLQVPWSTESLTEDFFFAAAAEPSPSPSSPTVPPDAEAEISFWQSITASERCGDYEAYLEVYADGRFAPLARSRVRDLCGKSISLSEAEVAVAGVMNVRDALTTCDEHLEADRLTTGNRGNALDCYEELLQIDPSNEQALAGIVKIEKKYIDWIEREIERNNIGRANAFLARLKAVNESQPAVGRLEERLSSLAVGHVEMSGKSASGENSESSLTEISGLLGRWQGVYTCCEGDRVVWTINLNRETDNEIRGSLLGEGSSGLTIDCNAEISIEKTLTSFAGFKTFSSSCPREIPATGLIELKRNNDRIEGLSMDLCCRYGSNNYRVSMFRH